MQLTHMARLATTGLLVCLAPCALALDMDFGDSSSVNSGLAQIAKGLMDYYNGNDTGETPGMFSHPYYWWEAGVAWGALIDYWYYTGDDTYNDVVKSSMVFQVGRDWDYMPSNQSTTEGNDDQGFWGIAVMAAAEKNFTNPPDDEPQWLYLAQAVFNTMADRWDTDNCNGGLRWQIYTWNNGYDYKNAVSNGCLFNLACRLARYTDNQTYTEWAHRVWDWAQSVEFINASDTDSWPIYDGGYIRNNCTDTEPIEWTYNSGLFMSGAAFMYNYTNDTQWLDRATRIWGRSKVFFMNDEVMYEAACQPSKQCNNDQRCFKGIYSRLLGLTCLMAPSLSAEIQKYLGVNSAAVLRSCSGGSDGHTCGLDWSNSSWDGIYGLGEQISALEALQNRLVWTKPPVLSEKDGATSKGNGSAGSSKSHTDTANELNITGKDRAGAGILTTLAIILLLLGGWWIIV